MKNWGAKEWVAVILSVCILLPFGGLVLTGAIEAFSGKTRDINSARIEYAQVIGDIMKVIIGGLIGWIAGRNGNEKLGQSKSTNDNLSKPD